MRTLFRTISSWVLCRGEHLWGFWTGPNYGWPKEKWYFTENDHCSRCGKIKDRDGWYD